jgi:hypothetical protein
MLCLTALVLVCATTAAQAEDKVMMFNFADSLRSPQVAPMVNKRVRVVWNERDLPEYTERSDPEDYTRSSDFSGFSGSANVKPAADKCAQAFRETIAVIQQQAIKQQYDVVLVKSEDPAVKRADQYACTLGYATNDVRLVAEFFVSKEFSAKLAANPPEAVKPPPRNPSDGVLTFSIDSMLATPEVKSILASKVRTHWGFKAVPTYMRRNGPQEFHSEQSAKESAEGGCKAAFVATLKDMIESAEEDGFTGVVRIHSSLDDQRAPDDGLFECRVKRRDADVSLSGILVVLQ